MSEEKQPAPQKPLALHKAVKYQIFHKVNQLLPLTRDMDRKDENGNTALVLACELGNKEIIDLFLNHEHVRFDVEGNGGFTALHCLCFKGNLRVIRKIIDKPQVDVNVETETKDTPLILATKMGHVDVIRFLIDKGANIHHRNAKYFTALSYACNNGRLEAAKALIELGADVNARNTWDQTPLMKASQWGFARVCELLLQKGARVDDQCNFKYTALCYATYRNQLEVSRVLLQAGADPNHVSLEEGIKTTIRRTPLSNACYQKNPALVRLLLSYAVDVHYPGPYSMALFSCVNSGSVTCAMLLLREGVDIDGRTRAGKCAVEIARRKGHYDIVALLERNGY